MTTQQQPTATRTPQVGTELANPVSGFRTVFDPVRLYEVTLRYAEELQLC